MRFKDAICLWLVVWGVFSWPDSQSFLKENFIERKIQEGLQRFHIVVVNYRTESEP